MEITGKITVTKTKKGYQILFVYEKNGKEKKETVSCFKVDNDRYNGKDCVVTKDKGVIVRFVVKLDEKEEVLYSKKSLQCSSETNDEIMLDSYNINKSFLPLETKSLMESVQSVDNFALKLNKASRYDERDNKGQKDEKFYFFKHKKGNPRNNIPDEKYQIRFPDAYNNFPFKNLTERHRHSIEALNLSMLHCEGAIDWRLIVGLGNESVYETSMTLHHVYGIPYIPASAVKGVVRSWMITEIFSDVSADPEEKNSPLVNAEYRAYQDQGFCKIFGCPAKTKKVLFENGEPAKGDKKYETYDTALAKEHQGRVWFFDAFSLSKPEIEVDIMNPHYMPYYSDGEPPADYHDPKPIPFLTVKRGTVFQFLVGIKDSDDEVIESGQFHGRKPSEVVKEWLKKALEEHGIGAKTAVGYGYMKDCKIEGIS